MTSLILFSSHYDLEPVGRAAGNSGQHTVSPAPSDGRARHAEMRGLPAPQRLDRPAAYPTCPQGHMYTWANTAYRKRGFGGLYRRCRECERIQCRRHRARKRAEAASQAVPRALPWPFAEFYAAIRG